MCVCVLCLAGSGGPASWAHSGAPHLFLWPLCLSALLGPLQAGVAPLSLAAVAVPRCLGAVFWLSFSASRCLALRALAPRLCLPLGRWLLFGGCSPPPSPSVSRGFPRFCVVPWCFFFLLFFFLLCAPPLSLAFSGFRPRVPWASALRVVCFVGLPLPGSPCACPSFVLSARLLAAPWWLLPPHPPLCLAVFVAAARCCVPCAVLCCASLGAVLRRAAARCVARCCAVVCCVALVWCRCLLRRALWRCPSPWGPVLCGAVFCAVPPRCVCFVVARWCVLLFAALLCAVYVSGCCAVRSLSSPLCAVLCFAVLVRSRCAVRVVRAVAGAWCCGALLCVVLFPVVCRGAVLGLVARDCLLVACFGVSVPVWPRGLLPCSCCGLLWCPAFLCRVLWRCAVVWCCAVVLCCRFAVLFVFALPSCGLRAAPVWSAPLLVPPAVACHCALWCLPGRSAVRWCCSGVSWCLAVLCVALWCPAPCAVSCGAVLPCGAVLVGCAVRLSALLVFVFPFVLFSFAKNPCRFSVPLKTF